MLGMPKTVAFSVAIATFYKTMHHNYHHSVLLGTVCAQHMHF